MSSRERGEIYTVSIDAEKARLGCLFQLHQKSLKTKKDFFSLLHVNGK